MQSYTEKKIQEIKHMLNVYKNRISDYPTGPLFFPLYRKFQEDIALLEEQFNADVINLRTEIASGKHEKNKGR